MKTMLLFLLLEISSRIAHGLELNSSQADEECLGNRLEALEIGRQCSRKCRKEVACENSRKQCLCDGLCGMSCIKPDLTCPELRKPDNGDYWPKTNLFNSRVSFRCDEGFYLFGSRERVCQGDEEWSGTASECLREPQCRTPPKINHARNPSDGSYGLDDRISYSCYPGYQSKGSSEAVCRLLEGARQTAWLWTSLELEESREHAFRCTPMSCGDPGQIANGRRHGDSFIVASSLLYTCNEGFEMLGQARRYCQSDSHWSGQAPQCKPTSCAPSDHLENGKINYNYPLVYNSTVEYACDAGFRLVGPRQRTCGADGRLAGEVPRCEEIDCGELGPLHNGFIKGCCNRLGDRKQFVCMEGMSFVGEHNSSTCLESGAWSNPAPRCMASCAVPRLENAESVYLLPPELVKAGPNQSLQRQVPEARPGSLAAHDDYLEVVCAKSFELEELGSPLAAEPARCQNGSWSYLPQCKPARCRQPPPSPKNGRVRVLGLEHGSRGFLHCLDGFKLKGQQVTECQHGHWSPLKATCLEVYCSFPGQIEHGRVLLVGLTGMYDYKPYIKRMPNNRQISYECEVGFRMNDGAPGGATCVDGLWKPEGLPTCVKE